MSWIIKFFHHYWPQLFLFLVISVLCLRNFTPGSFLTGWDNLHPEFNILENISRSIFSVWQEYQGLGLLAGMAHSADLVRQLIILPFTFIFPLNSIRYLWHFSMLFLGAFGIFYLCLHLTKSRFSSLVAALFYLLNFGTVQYFFLAFDPYSTFWGFFPWLIFFLLQYLENPKSLKKLFLINLLATPSFYVQTLFVVYLICVSLILFLYLLPNFKHKIKTCLNILILILAVNSFWLLPNIYFTVTNVSVTQNSMINLVTTDQFVEENLYRGNLASFGLLQGQYYDIKQYQNNIPHYIFAVWRNYLSSPLIQIIGYLLFATALLGLFSKNKSKKYFALILLFAAAGLLSSTFPFNYLNQLLRQIPLLNQIFRNPFTKLIVPAVFSLSLLLGLALARIKKYSLIFIPFILIFSFPSLTGQFFSPLIRAKIPDSYFQLFNYLKSQDSSKRILDLPQYDFWGWYNYSWGPSGSGFDWYGIPQPITSRTFDVWDNNLENFYWQLHYAIISRNPLYFDNLLGKYNISYILYDPNLYFSDAQNSGKVLLENEKVIGDALPNLKLEKQFGGLKLYSVAHPKSAITAFTALPNLGVPQNYTYLDRAYTDYGPYQNNPKFAYRDAFPFNSLFTDHPDTTLDVTSGPSGSTVINSPDKSYQFGLNPVWSACITDNGQSIINAINQENILYYHCGDNLDLSAGYLLRINSQNLAGRPLLVKVFSVTDHRLIIDTKINPSQNPQYLVIPPIYPFDSGIGINFSSLSLSQNPSVNQINRVDITPFNWAAAADLHFNSPPLSSVPQTVVFHRSNPTFYSALIQDPSVQSQLVLYQSYSSGWLAYYFRGPLPVFLPHFLVNNWANGWSSPAIPATVYLFFWPQLLEFLGFGLLLGSVIWILKNNSLDSR